MVGPVADKPPIAGFVAMVVEPVLRGLEDADRMMLMVAAQEDRAQIAGLVEHAVARREAQHRLVEAAHARGIGAGEHEMLQPRRQASAGAGTGTRQAEFETVTVGIGERHGTRLEPRADRVEARHAGALQPLGELVEHRLARRAIAGKSQAARRAGADQQAPLGPLAAPQTGRDLRDLRPHHLAMEFGEPARVLGAELEMVESGVETQRHLWEIRKGERQVSHILAMPTAKQAEFAHSRNSMQAEPTRARARPGGPGRQGIREQAEAWPEAAQPISSSESQYRKSRQLSCRKLGGKRRPFSCSSKVLGWRGEKIGNMRTSRGRWLPFKRLQLPQAVTTLVQAVRPPRERGITWSKVRSWVGKSSPQYWQTKRSRRKTLNLVKAGRRVPGTYSFSEMTLGSRISKVGERTVRSYSETMLTRPRNTALTASCQDQSDSGK